METWGVSKILSAFIAVFSLFGIIGGAVTLITTQIMKLSEDLGNISGKIMIALSKVVVFINRNVHFMEDLEREELVEQGKEWMGESSGALVQNILSSSAAFVSGLIATIIFTFLILIYREGLTKAIVAFGDEGNRIRIRRMLKNIQQVGKKYLSGMFLLIMILGFTFSIGLWIIGIDSPFLFGFFAATFAFIPYIGTPIAGTIPVLYAFMTTDSIWVPMAVIILFWVMQIIESNFLNPKIVGNSVNVNPLVAILSLLIGFSVWGIAGVVLFLPFAAMLKVVFDEFEQLKPLAMIMSSDIADENEGFRNSRLIKKIRGRFRKSDDGSGGQ